MRARAAGLLLHPTSLPGPFGIGDIGPSAVSFLDWMVEAGLTVWQILPLGPPGGGYSPYNALSAFAGNPWVLSPEWLVEDGFLEADALGHPPEFRRDRVDFPAVFAWKRRLLERSFRHFRRAASRPAQQEFEAFVEAPEQRGWLENWVLFEALRSRHAGREWTEWDPALRSRLPSAIDAARRELTEPMTLGRYVQFQFFRQWSRLRAHAHHRGIRIFGDLPIYPAHDSVDVWVHARLFALAADGRPEVVAGVPPDYFSREGQRWGNPLYRWERHREEGYAWWIERIRANLRIVDQLRLDHFRGFAAYWEVPASERTARCGRWVEGPGLEFFEALQAALGALPLVAEDLGHITPDVIALRRATGLPGMKVLQFGFGDADSDHLPHRHLPESVVYTGTHDNDTTRGWFEKVADGEKLRALDYLGGTPESMSWDFIRGAYASVADLCVAPVQDVLSLSSEARMNTPGVPEGNWGWRVPPGSLGSVEARRLRRLAELTGRLARQG